MFMNTIPVVTIYNWNLPLIWSSRMSSGYLALKWQGVRPPGMDCCMRVIIMFIKLCWDSLSWWINVARLRSRDSKVLPSRRQVGLLQIDTAFHTAWPTLETLCSQSCSIITIQISVFGGQNNCVMKQKMTYNGPTSSVEGREVPCNVISMWWVTLMHAAVDFYCMHVVVFDDT